MPLLEIKDIVHIFINNLPFCPSVLWMTKIAKDCNKSETESSAFQVSLIFDMRGCLLERFLLGGLTCK